MHIGIYTFDKGQANPLTFVTNFTGATPQKGCNIMPKHCLDVEKHEVDRFVRMTNTGIIDYISFKLPNRTGQFQEDLYPPFQSNTSASNYAAWAAGEEKPAITMQLRPGMDLNVNKSATKSDFFKPKTQDTAVANTPAQNEQQVFDDGEKSAQIASLTEEVNNLKQENDYLKSQ